MKQLILLHINFSNNLPMHESNEIGQYESREVVGFPSLAIGRIIANFQSYGIFPVLKLTLNISRTHF